MYKNNGFVLQISEDFIAQYQMNYGSHVADTTQNNESQENQDYYNYYHQYSWKKGKNFQFLSFLELTYVIRNFFLCLPICFFFQKIKIKVCDIDHTKYLLFFFIKYTKRNCNVNVCKVSA
jgi:hypothetical protein